MGNTKLVVSQTNRKTRMHSSRMRTVRCSGHVGERGVYLRGCLPGGGVCRGEGGSVQGRWGVYLPSPVDRILDTRLCKHYLSTTTVADGNEKITLTIIGTLFTVLTRYASLKNMCVQDSTSIPGANDMFNIIRIKRIFARQYRKRFQMCPTVK